MNAVAFSVWWLETSFAIGALVVFVLLIRRPFARRFGARLAYALWLLPLARLFLVELRVLPSPAPAPATDAPGATWSLEQTYSYGSPLDAASIPVAEAAILAIAGVWIAGALVGISTDFRCRAEASRRLFLNSVPADDDLRSVAASVAMDLGFIRPPAVRVLCATAAEDARAPFVQGGVWPIVYVPADFAAAFDAAELRCALAHEFAHVRRGDLAAAAAARAMLALQWPNPLAPSAWRAFLADQEAACDAFVLSSRAVSSSGGATAAAAAYAAAILKAAGRSVASRKRAPAPAGELFLAHQIKERLMAIKERSSLRAPGLPGAAALGALAVAGLAATADYGRAAEPALDSAAAEEAAPKRIEKHIVVINGDGGEIREVHVQGEGATAVEYDVEIADGEERPAKRVMIVRMPDAPAPPAPPGVFEFGFKNDNCVAAEGEPEPARLEWEEREGEGEVYRSVICIDGEDAATPAARKAALKKAIDEMEAKAKAEQARKARMIAGLRQQLRAMD